MIKIKAILMFLSLMPSITFGLIEAEVFPWAMLLSLFFINRIYKELIVFLLILTPSLLYGYYNTEALGQIVRSLAAYINGFILFLVAKDLRRDELLQYKNIVFFALKAVIVVSLIQYLFGFDFIELFIKKIVPRASVDADYRGVSGLSSEPARNAVEIILYISFLMGINSFKSRYLHFVDVGLLTYLLVVNRSMTGLIFYVIYIVARIVDRPRVVYVYALPFFVAYIYFGFYLQDGIYSMRSLRMIYELNGADHGEVVKYIVNQSGHRIGSVYAGYMYSGFLGYGIGNMGYALLDIFYHHPYLYDYANYFQTHSLEGMRIPSYFAGLIVEGGVGTTILFIVYIVFLVKNKFAFLSSDCSVNGNLVYVLPILFGLFFMGTIGSPINFLLLGLMIRFSFYKISAK